MSDKNRIEIMQGEFMEHHKDADELVFGVNSGICLGAVYFSPKEKALENPLRTFFKAISDAMTISDAIEALRREEKSIDKETPDQRNRRLNGVGLKHEDGE